MQVDGIRIHITVGGREILRCDRLELKSARHLPLGRASITLPDPTGELLTAFQDRDPVSIKYGYRGEDPAEWTGTVSWIARPARNMVEIGAVDQARVLVETLVRQAWEDEHPEAIVAWAVGKTGLATAQIDAPGGTLPRFTASSIPVWQVAYQAAQSVHRHMGRDMTAWAFWLGPDGIHWGDHDQDGDVPVIASHTTLISHTPVGDHSALSEVTSFLLAGLTHSRLVRVTDQRRGTDEIVRALGVSHVIERGRARTFVRYGEEYGLF